MCLLAGVVAESFRAATGDVRSPRRIPRTVHSPLGRRVPHSDVESKT